MEINKSKNITWIIVALILTLGVIISAQILVNGIVSIKTVDTLTVKGSAKKQITSDFIVWTGSYSVQSPSLQEGYALLNKNTEQVKKYLMNNNVKEEDIIFSSIRTSENYEVLYNGYNSNKIESYTLYQTVEISSNDIDKITEISRNSTSLINEGVAFKSKDPQYFYTKLADLKIDMIALATEDAKNRAERMLETTNNKVGKLKSARVGIFQITPLYSNEISDYGINDTSSYEKEITSVVTCEFEVK